MAVIPRNEVSIFGLFIFVAWLVWMVGIPEISSPLDAATAVTTGAEKGLGNAAVNLTSEGTGTLYGSITSVFSLLYNLIVLIISVPITLFVTLATFISAMTFLPYEISGIFVALISIGTVMYLIRYIIPE